MISVITMKLICLWFWITNLICTHLVTFWKMHLTFNLISIGHKENNIMVNIQPKFLIPWCAVKYFNFSFCKGVLLSICWIFNKVVTISYRFLGRACEWFCGWKPEQNYLFASAYIYLFNYDAHISFLAKIRVRFIFPGYEIVTA